MSRSPTDTLPAPGMRTAPAPAEARGLGPGRGATARRDGRTRSTHPASGTSPSTSRRGDLAGRQRLRRRSPAAADARSSVAVVDDRRRARRRAPGLRQLGRSVELRTAPDAERPVLDARAGERSDARRGVPCTLVAPYPRGAPRRPVPATGCGARRVTGDLRPGHLAAYGRPIAYGYLDRRIPLPTTRRYSPAPRQRRDASARPAVHAGAGDAAGRGGRRRRADHAAHRGLVAGGRRAAPAGVVRGAADHRRAGERRARPGRARDRGRDHGDAGARVGGRRRRLAASRAAAGPSSSSRPTDPPGSSTG